MRKGHREDSCSRVHRQLEAVLRYSCQQQAWYASAYADYAWADHEEGRKTLVVANRRWLASPIQLQTRQPCLHLPERAPPLQACSLSRFRCNCTVWRAARAMLRSVLSCTAAACRFNASPFTARGQASHCWGLWPIVASSSSAPLRSRPNWPHRVPSKLAQRSHDAPDVCVKRTLWPWKGLLSELRPGRLIAALRTVPSGLVSGAKTSIASLT